MSDTPQNQVYTKARFFKCALQVNPVGYTKYRGQPQALSEDQYNQQLLDASLEAGVEVVALADHGSVDGLEKIRTLFSENEILVFPGFEVASSEKIHFVCIFDESKTVQELERILGSLRLLDPQDGVRPSKLSAEQLIDEVNQQSGFIYAAHCTSDSGLLKVGKMNHVWQHKGLLASQIPGSVDDLKGVESDFYRKVFLNKDPNYRREREMAAINAADVAKPEDIKGDSASCLIKMTKPCFASFKQAFLDAGSRVRLNSDVPENHASALESIRFVGGYLDGVDIELSDHLNAVIGGRGTGKSTLLECIRFAFDLEIFSDAAKKQHDTIVKDNLGVEKGMVEITVRSAKMHGRKFTVSRKYGSHPFVTDEAGEVAPYQPKDLLPGIEFYGQNEIYELTRDERSRHKVIGRFLKSSHEQFDITLSELKKKLRENGESIERALAQKSDVEAEVERLPKLLDEAKQFKALGIEEKLKIVPKLEKEKQLTARVKEELAVVDEAVATLSDSIIDAVFLSDASVEGLPHADLLSQHHAIIEKYMGAVGQIVVKLGELSVQAAAELEPIQRQLSEKIVSEEKELEDAFKEIPTSHGKTGRQIGAEYQTLLKHIESIKPKQDALQNRQAQINELYQQRKKWLLELEQQTSARASAMQKSLKRFNKKLDQKVRLNLRHEGNRQEIVEFLVKRNLEGVGAKRLSWVLEGDFSTASLAATIRQGEAALVNSFGVSAAVVKALSRLPESALLALEELVLPDTMVIELNVSHGEAEAKFRAIEGLSTGQQCTAVLHLLLVDNEDPLLLDQPEDNLDNAFIANRIVAELRRAKLSRQFLFATHNANIPVFGDAEWIGVLSGVDNKGVILPEQQGAIDVPEVQRLAADILEGGESAFNQRREKYGFN